MITFFASGGLRSNFLSRIVCEFKETSDFFTQVYVFEVEDDAVDGEKGENREKRKIGLKLGVTNGVINFVFGVSSVQVLSICTVPLRK